MNRKHGTESTRPRQADIARLAGVSQGTVSLIINGRASTGRILDETRDRVLSVAHELGYVPDPAARRLAGGRNRLIGIFTYESVFPLSHHDFYHPFLVGIEEQAERHGYDLVLFTSATGTSGERGIFVDGQNRIGLADGAIILGREMRTEEIVSLRNEGYPFTLVGRRDIPGEVPYVTADYRRGTVDAFAELARLGHTHVAYVSSSDDTHPAHEREAGYQEAAAALTVVELDGSQSADGLAGSLAELIATGTSAVVTHYAETAIEVEAALALRGIRVPDDVSILALNDPPDDDPSIGGLRIPRREMGAMAFDLLIDQLESDDPEHAPIRRVLPTGFAAGRTVAPLPQHRRNA
ncbi:LacI family DNA-binding transcriptional regulator [Agromyces terreus]